jgi:hypothetical protein
MRTTDSRGGQECHEGGGTLPTCQRRGLSLRQLLQQQGGEVGGVLAGSRQVAQRRRATRQQVAPQQPRHAGSLL